MLAIILSAGFWTMAAVDAFAGDAQPLPSNQVSLQGLLSDARRLNPEIAAAAFAAEAAAARAAASGKLDDPTLALISNRNSEGWPAPGSHGMMTYSVTQSFPLWGKLALKRDAAEAETKIAKSDKMATEREILARLRTLYADYYRNVHALAAVEEGHKIIHGLGATAESRYAQGLADRQEVSTTEIERSKLEASSLRLHADIRRARIRLNTLLARAAEAPLDDPAPPPPVPSFRTEDADRLLEQALETSPVISAEKARIDVARANRALSDKAWYPDLTAGIGMEDNAPMNGNDRYRSYMAMLSINLPLSWGVKRAGQHAAGEMLLVAEKNKQAALLNTEADIRVALADLQATEQVLLTIRDDRLPQADIAYRSAVDAYQAGRMPLRPVIEAYHQWLDAKLDLLAIEAEQQSRFADLERAVGVEL
jgi:outer membrane protein TolC